jgi:hypothetical protein
MPSGASGAVLTGVSCVSSADCIAVGMSNYQFAVAAGEAPEDLALAEHWDGVAWTIMPTPNPSAIGASGYTFAQLLGVSCASTTACTAVGLYYSWPPNSRSFVYTLTLAERWDGARWSIQPPPTPGTVAGGPITNGGVLNAVSCPSVAVCMAGDAIVPGGTSLAEYWNGRKWSTQKTADRPGSYEGSFNGVACTSRRARIAVGASTAPVSAVLAATGPLAERWDGTGWSRMSIVVPSSPYQAYSALDGVSCVSSTACVAAGVREVLGAGAENQPNLIELWTGQDWTIQPAASPAEATYAVLAACHAQGHSAAPSGVTGRKPETSPKP